MPHVDEAYTGLHCTVVEDEEMPARQREQGVDVVPLQHLDREPAAVRVHDSTRYFVGAGTDARNCVSASIHAGGFSNCGECPASGMIASSRAFDRVGHLARRPEERLVLQADEDERRAAHAVCQRGEVVGSGTRARPPSRPT